MMAQPTRPASEVIARAQQLADTGQPAQAAAMLVQLLQAQPGNAEARYLLAVSNLRAGEVVAAETGFREVVAANPRDHRAFHGLGLALEQQGRFADAVGAFRAAVGLNAGFAPAQRKLAEHGAASRPPPAPTSPPATTSPAPAQSPPSAQPATVPARESLQGLRSPAGRLVRGVSMLVVGVAFAFTLIWTLIAIYAVVIGGESEAGGFAVVVGGVTLVLWSLLWAIGRVGGVRVRGMVRQLSFRREALPSRGRGAPPTLQIVSFTLETSDRHRYQFPQIAVELRGKRLRGTVRDGDQVEIKGRLTRYQYLHARSIRVLTTGEIVVGVGSGAGSRVAAALIWLPFLTVVGLIVAAIVAAGD